MMLRNININNERKRVLTSDDKYHCVYYL